MKLPFDTEQFLNVFQNYNNAVYPAQVLLFLIALLIIFLTFKKTAYSDKIIIAGISFLWIWMGVMYHIVFFSTINKPAYLFGSLFVAQGILLAVYGFKKKISFSFKKNAAGYSALVLIIYALIIYPLIGYFNGHVYPKSPTFGLPCPTTIFTFGILLMTDKSYPVKIFIIPLIWSVIGFTAAIYLGIYEDIGLLVSGLITFLIIIFYKNSESVKNK